MKSKMTMGCLIAFACVLTSCATPPFVEFKWSNDSSTWATYNFDGLIVKVPRELKRVQENPALCGFAISGYEGNGPSDYVGFVIKDGLFVKYPTTKSIQEHRNSIIAHNGRILANVNERGGFCYIFPVSQKLDQKTFKYIDPPIVQLTEYGWIFFSADGRACNIYLRKAHDGIDYHNWIPEAVFSQSENKLLEEVYNSVGYK